MSRYRIFILALYLFEAHSVITTPSGGQCATLAISPHGHWNNGGPANTNIGAKNFWHCDAHYISVPPNAVLTCQSNAQWDNVVPRCDPDATIVRCPSLPKCSHGQYIKQRDDLDDCDEGQSHRVKCDSYYDSDGDDIFSCRNGLWDKSPRRCIPKKCTSLPKCEHGAYVKQDNYLSDYDEGQSHKLKCHDDYECDGDDTVTCRNGQWDKSPSRCKPKRCPPLIKYDHLSYIKQKSDRDDCDDGQSHRIKCDDKYDIDGDDLIACRNAKWDNSPRRCYSRGPCATLAISPHGHWNNGGPANTNIGVPNFWHCDKGYISVPPNAVLTCQSNSQWDNVVPRCDPAN